MSESIKIKDAPLVSHAGDDVKMPCSDGSGLPKAVSVSQIAEHIMASFQPYLEEGYSYGIEFDTTIS